MLKQTLALVGLSVLTLSANAALYDRGNGMIYDSTLDITWLQDANYAQTSGYAAANAVGAVDSGSYNIQASGSMGWDAAKAWAAQLEYGGHNDWRLPTGPDLAGAAGCSAQPCDTSELGHLITNSLQNEWGSPYDYLVHNLSFVEERIDGNVIVSFTNYQGGYYWTGDQGNATDYAWTFYMLYGYDLQVSKPESFNSWAVRDGDVSSVPVPAAAWLFGSALIGLVGIKRKN